ncbi:MAG: M28 family peptidase [bacterium]|nr:M28 family peptidase [bacterium]
MKLIRLSIVLFCGMILLIGAKPLLAADLYHVSLQSRQDAATLSDSGADIEPVIRLNNAYLVLVGPGGLERIIEAGLQHELIAQDLARDQLGLDIRKDNSNTDNYPVLYESGRTRLVRVDPSLFESGANVSGIAPLGLSVPGIIYKEPTTLDLSGISRVVNIDSLIALISVDSCSSHSHTLETFGSRFIGTPGNYASRDWAEARFREFGYDSVVVDSFSISYDTRIECQNVYAVKVGGLYPNHQIVVGAHRDNYPITSPGADDDGSGSVAVLELARVLQGIETNMTIVFVLFDSEELGLYGAWHHANCAAARGDSVVLMHNMDMIGHIENDQYAIVWSGGTSFYGDLWDSLANASPDIAIDAAVDVGAYWDDAPFWENGYDVVTSHESIFSIHYHSAHDSTTYLSYDYLTRMTRAAMATMLVTDAAYVPEPTLSISLPNGYPQMLYPTQETEFDLLIESYAGGAVVPGSGRLHLAIDRGEFMEFDIPPLTPAGGDLYRAVIPPLDCYNTVSYFISADKISGGTVTFPDTTQPMMAASATFDTVLFEDDFQNFEGWAVFGDATEGAWERREPHGGGWHSDPPHDFDGSGLCYVTDNETAKDVDGGSTFLRSPSLQLGSADAIVQFSYWFASTAGNDYLKLYVSSGINMPRVLVKTIYSSQANRGWYTHRFWPGQYITLTDDVRLFFEAADAGAESTVEAAIDAVSVTQFWCLPPPVITTDSLPDWTALVPYSQQIESSGGDGLVTYSDKNDELVGSGLSLAANGLLSGTVVAADTIAFAVLATDQVGHSDELPVTVVFNPALLIVDDFCPDATAGVPYAYRLVSSGGTGEKNWSDSNNDLPTIGMTLGPDGLITGLAPDTGITTFTAVVADQVGAVTEKSLTLHVDIFFLCGDATNDGALVDIADLTFVVDYLFGGGSPPEIERSADVDGSGFIDIADLTYFVDWFFASGPDLNCP